MILVADSGSTKCDWLLMDANERHETKTMGFNPFFHSYDLILEELAKNSVLNGHKMDVAAIFFYGAGCSSPDRISIVSSALKTFFSNAHEVVVDHDLTGAAVATCGDSPGIACILGTGSNSCSFDGQKITENIPALGFILGDEGSGSYYGKVLLSEFLYKRLPNDLQSAFADKFKLSKEDIFLHIYNRPNVNVYLASFMKFISDHRSHPYLQDLILKGLNDFAQIHILCYAHYREVPVHFVGSIAHYFRELLQMVADDLGFRLGTVVKKPIEPLAEFHMHHHIRT